VTGSTKFGSLSTNTHQFTGSVFVTGALSGTSATFRVSTDRNLATRFDSNIVLSAQSDSGAPESLRVYADTFRLFTATTAVGLTERFTISNTGAATFSSSVQSRGFVAVGASGGYTTGDNTYINLGGAASTDSFGAINMPFGDRMKFNSYHGFEFKTSNAGASGTPVLKATISTEGYLRLASNGIQFNGDTADANSLDDYEEGTWTPTIEGDSSSPTLTGYSTQVGRYTKVGRLVTIHCGLQPSATITPGTGNLRFGGLPFTSANISDVVGTGVASSNGNFSWGSGRTQLNFSVGVNTTKVFVWAMQNGTVESGVPVNNFNNSNQYLLFSLTYMTT
jgi:hypothetical protein